MRVTESVAILLVFGLCAGVGLPPGFLGLDDAQVQVLGEKRISAFAPDKRPPGYRVFYGMPLAVSYENIDMLDMLWANPPQSDVNIPWIDHPKVPICTDPISMFVAVVTRPDAYERRMTIRTSMFLMPEFGDGRAVGRFFIGFNDAINNAEAKERIRQEINDYKDIVIFQQPDNYRNLPLKVWVAYHWISVYYPNIQFYTKVDDDLWVNINYLWRKTQEYPSTGLVYLGDMREGGAPDRNATKSWHISVEDYPEAKLPKHASGGAYMVSNEAMKRILAKRPYRFLPIEDAAVGLRMRELDRDCVKKMKMVDSCDRAAMRAAKTDKVRYIRLGPFPLWNLRKTIELDNLPNLMHPLNGDQIWWAYEIQGSGPGLTREQTILFMEEILDESADKLVYQ